jgi:ribulose-phosphate 3-epimerase
MAKDKVIEIIPSILSADFSMLWEEIKKVEKAGCQRLHLDVMDGNFVPNITFGPVVIEAIRRRTGLYLEAHLMIDRPERYIHSFKQAGVNGLALHQEACSHFIETIKLIKVLKMAAGVALNPETPVESIEHVIRELDFILIMTVEAGFGGQSYIPGTENKIREVLSLLNQEGRHIPVEVDGGIDMKTAPLVVQAGATRLVAGHAIFSGDVIRNVERLRAAANADV